MAGEAIELIFRFKAENKDQLEAMKKSFAGMTAEVKSGDDALKKFGNTSKGTNDSLGVTILKADLLARAFIGVSGAIASYVKDAAQYAARTQQLAVISDSLARANGLSVQGVRTQADEVRKLGITTQTAYELTSRLIQARVDLSKAPALARVAQDAAKIAGINSSEALERMVMSIGTGMVRPLHQMGLMVNFQGSYAEYAAQHGKANAGSLDEQEKAAARLQATLKAGVGIFGTYEASQLTAAGQMQSMSRYVDELKNKFGEGLQPVMFSIIGTMRTLTQVAGTNVDQFQHLASGAAALAVGGSVFAATSFLPLPYRAGAAALAAGGTYFATDKDPAQTQIAIAKDAIEGFDLKQAAMQNEPDAYSAATIEEAKKNAPRARAMIAATARMQLARIYKQRQERHEFLGDPLKLTEQERRIYDATTVESNKNPDSLATFAKTRGHLTNSAYPASIDLGSGVIITGEQLRHEFDKDRGGNLIPPPLEDEEKMKALMDLVRSKGKSLREQVNQYAMKGMSTPDRIAAQARFSRTELGREFQGFTPGQLKASGVGV
ncbi:MAG TPA: hypothetical protein VNH18_36930, partial [Bryobacteraceae bacterium]|nr:hypothetical protein [Bryobacteraceae bacterium]